MNMGYQEDIHNIKPENPKQNQQDEMFKDLFAYSDKKNNVSIFVKVLRIFPKVIAFKITVNKIKIKVENHPKSHTILLIFRIIIKLIKNIIIVVLFDYYIYSSFAYNKLMSIYTL
jgi:hypothetical protein